MNQERQLFLENLIRHKNLLATKQGQIFVGEYEKKQRMDSKGYLRIKFSVKSTDTQFFSHQIIACFFHGFPKPGYVVNHKNGIKDDNRPENLEWVTVAQNNQHAYDTGLKESPYSLRMRRIPKIKEPKGERIIETLVIATFHNYQENYVDSAKAMGMCRQKFRRGLSRAKKMGLIY